MHVTNPIEYDPEGGQLDIITTTPKKRLTIPPHRETDLQHHDQEKGYFKDLQLCRNKATKSIFRLSPCSRKTAIHRSDVQ